jgi:hypothetical protein
MKGINPTIIVKYVYEIQGIKKLPSLRRKPFKDG